MATLAETWLERGRKQGIEQDIGQGELSTLRSTLKQLLAKRFGPLPESLIQQIDIAERDVLQIWFERGLDAASLEAVFVD